MRPRFGGGGGADIKNVIFYTNQILGKKVLPQKVHNYWQYQMVTKQRNGQNITFDQNY